MPTQREYDEWWKLAEKKFEDFIGPRPLLKYDPNSSMDDKLRCLSEQVGVDYDEYERLKNTPSVIYL